MYELHQSFVRQSLRLTGFQSRRLATAVGRVHVLEASGRGTLPPLVLLHGLSASAAHYRSLMTRLRGRVKRIIAPDMPGHGLSDTPAPGVSIDGMRRGLQEALDRVIDEPVVIFGNSMGGFAAAAYASARPERVRGLILCSPGGALVTAEELATFLASFNLRTHREALEFVDRFLASRSRMRHLLAWGVKRSMGQPCVRALLEATSPEHLLRPEELERLSMPVLLLWGKAEKVLPESHLDYFRLHLPAHTRVERPPHYGHAPYLEHPKDVSRKVLGFLSEVAGTGA